MFNAIRKLLRDALDTGVADQLGLDREFITALPTAGATTGRTARRPFPDEVARALAAEANLAELAATYDLNDNGARDIWETTVTTGRRIGEVIKVRWDCIGRYGGLAMFWHDQTKVGNYDAAIRIPERLYDVLAERQRKTLDRFTARYGYRPAGAQRAQARVVPHDLPQPRRDGVTDPPVVLQPVPALGGRHGPRPLRPAPGQAHPGDQPAPPWRDPDTGAPMTGGDGGRTAAAVAARQHNAQASLAQVRDVLARMSREKTPVTVAAIAASRGLPHLPLLQPRGPGTPGRRHAGTRARTAQDLADRDARQEAAWRERALNAEDALKAAHAEIARRRERIGELLGQVRDLEADWTQDAIQRITTENTTLKQRVRQLTGDNRTLDERLKAARSNLRFQDRRVADLEAQLLDSPQK